MYYFIIHAIRILCAVKKKTRKEDDKRLTRNFYRGKKGALLVTVCVTRFTVTRTMSHGIRLMSVRLRIIFYLPIFLVGTEEIIVEIQNTR